MHFSVFCLFKDVYARIVINKGLQGGELKTKRTELLGLKESFNESFVFNKISDPSNLNVRITLIQHRFIGKKQFFIAYFCSLLI